MKTLSDRWACGVAATAGALLWTATTTLTGRREAWDAGGYWGATYPLSIAVAAVVGFLAPRRAWRWGLVVMVAQAERWR